MWLFRQPDDRFFDEHQRKQIVSLFEAILPGDDRSPGATDADAAEYLDRLLAMDDSTYYEIRDWKALYGQALPALDQAAQALFGGRGLESLTVPETTELVEQLSAGALTGMPADIDQRALFSTIRGHCIEGCFSDPRWGGNSGGLMWSWYGYLDPAQTFRRAGRGDA